MIMSILRNIILITLLFSGISCKNKDHANNLFSGDLLFCSVHENELSDFSNAINAVTQTEKKQNYTHIGIVQIDSLKIYVIHSTPDKGVIKESLESFIKKYPNPHIYRLTEDFVKCIPEALALASTLVGNEYDHAFTMIDKSQYCSGLIYNIFKNCNIFILEPMSFKNPITGKTEEFWIKYFDNINEKIPEGVLGCNPNGMAKSEAIIYSGILK